MLCLVVLLSSWFASPAPRFRAILIAVFIYLATNLGLGFVSEVTLRRKRVRAAPAIMDVAFTSCLIFLTGGESSPWYLLYVFPILSVSRYLSYEGSVSLALVATIAYAIASFAAGSIVSLPNVILKGMVLVGIAFVAGNLGRTIKRKDDDLLDIFRRIDNAIINDVETDQVLKMILEKAVSFTESALGQMTVFGEEQRFAYFVSIKADNRQPDWPIQALTARYHSEVQQSKTAVSVLTIKTTKHGDKAFADEIVQRGKAHIYVLQAQVEDADNMPGAALFVPLILNGEVKAIISLYSKDRFHYFDIDAVKLGSLAPALGIALKHSSEIEKKQRLKLLHRVGERLKVEQGLSEVFETVVALTWNQLSSEEAALFVLNDELREGFEITKVSVKGPSAEITKELRKIEQPYKPGESLVGKIFKERQLQHLYEVPSKVLYHDKYSGTLPSGRVQHYIGVPLIIGDEVLGVLRVINKRASTYSVEDETFELSEEGFSAEDVELMETLASQVAAAIRSAKFIEVHRNYHELVEDSPDPIIVLDHKGRVKIFNKACETIWGYVAEEVIGNHVTKYYETAAHALEIGDLLEKTPTHRLRDFEAKIKAFDDEIIPISLSASLLFDFRGKKVGSIGVFKDLRDTQRLQAEKTNAERLATLGKLAHTVGHEIKHLIAIALSYVDTLKFESRGNEELSGIYSEIQDSLQEAVDKFQNMLMVGKPRPLEKRVIGVEDILQKAESQMRQRVDAEKIELSIAHTNDDYELEADITQLGQVLFNLFVNSIDAIKARKQTDAVQERGRIQLSALTNNGNLKLTWADNGCGIPAASLPQIFTPFVTSKPTGNGLGLFLVKSIVEQHGGSVSVESAEGKGTRFDIVLPLSQQTTSA